MSDPEQVTIHAARIGPFPTGMPGRLWLQLDPDGSWMSGTVMSADQHIRALALDAATRTLADGEEGGQFGSGSSEITVRWVLATAGRFAAWIRDGQAPDAG